jgi:tRNA threonylcarbamoyladenosine biosynthesis protein TsaE
MSHNQIHTTSEIETQAVAERIGELVVPGTVILLEGDLGAGKTTFTKGLAKGLGVKRNVNSPTFNIIKEYKGRLPLYHMDVYRLNGGDEDLGFDEYFNGDGVCVVEWAHLIEDFLPKEYMKLIIRRSGENEREIEILSVGERYETLSKELMEDDRFSN